jgi:Domain of unknown function (DUF5916)
MIRTTVALVVLVIISVALCGAETLSSSKPVIRVPHIATPPRIDDFLAGKSRPDMVKVTEFRQREPKDGAPASLGTAAYLGYDDAHFYAVFVCKDRPSNVRAHMSRRDNISGDDSVSLSLDTFHDQHRAYAFYSNSLGVQSDAMVTEGQDDDYSYDGVWSSAGRIVEDGYIVVISVPFKTLRYNSNPGTWGIALARYTPGLDEVATWPYISRNVEAWVPQFGNAAIADRPDGGRNLQLNPYMFWSRERFLDANSTHADFERDSDVRVGLDAKMVVRNAATFDFTANPDFSQVESDEPQVTINQRYEVYFPEKRPFFTESNGFFQTPEALLFTRRIVAPQYGARMTSKMGRLTLGALAIDDRAPGQTLVDTATGARANIGVLRAQYEVSPKFDVGMFFSNWAFAGANNRALAFDTRAKLSDNWVFTGQFTRTSSAAAGVPANGTGVLAELKRTGRRLSLYGSYLDRTPDFHAELGFIPRVDIRRVRNDGTYRWRPKAGSVLSFGPGLYTYVDWDHRGVMQDWYVDAPFTVELKGGTSVSAGHTSSFERFGGIGFRKEATYVSGSTERSKWVSLAGSYSFGSGVNYSSAGGVAPFVGRATDASAGVKFKPAPRVLVENSYIYSRLGVIGGSAIYNNHIIRTKVQYQLARRWSARAIVDYDAVLSNPAFVSFDRTKRVNLDLLATWMLNPGTALYVGYNTRRENLALDPTDAGTLHRIADPSLNTGSQFFVKASYLFRF